MSNQPIIDSALSREEALAQNPAFVGPADIINQQVIIVVQYWSVDNQLHQGQIVIEKRLAEDVQVLLEAIVREKFPLASVIPVADPRFRWDYIVSMTANNSSGFNYRTVAGS